MKTSTKVLLGIGVSALAGTAVAVFVSDKVIQTVKKVKNRYLIKQFVNDKLEGNDKLLNIVDDLSDTEIESVVGILHRVKEGKNRITVSGNAVKEATEEAKKFLANFVESFTNV